MSNEKLKQIHDDARKNDVPIMLDDGLAFLLQYIRTHESIRDILEIGTAVGYSAINMAAIRWDIVIDTLEVNSEMAAQAEKNIAQENLSERIHVHLGDASVYETKKIYDLIFIDAAKSQYRRYLEHFLKNSRIGTVFIFDNLNFHARNFLCVEVVDALVFCRLAAELETMADLVEDILDAVSQ